ncbi:MAG: antibiotic biosynthesis monooxygenase [Dyadobacter sp.]|uniref:putative quinol monooxygenase n=1 Tax=Dyadobacter sp. TaxID=1914288 RepID=UPI001B19D504|nr:antibiotic biosynthesis monooxygenase [Dyadobacter sp.]MBO9611450.1 antibiotic biosynthesis monooxygenase [Dyadobacter sp.]
MKAKMNFSPYRWLSFGMIWLGLGGMHAQANGTAENNLETVAVLTRYDVKESSREAFQQALKSYVAMALMNDHNIMAEAYTEQEQPLVFWVIERWNSKAGFEGNAQLPPSQKVDCLSENALSKAAQRLYIKDLEPVSKKQWRTEAAGNDTPLTIMLFVDAHPGTEKRFQQVYHAAMPRFRGEPGVINYQLSQLADDSTRFVTYEKFRSEEAFQYHLNYPPIQPVIDYLNTSIRQQPFQKGLHRLIAVPETDSRIRIHTSKN